MAKKVTKEQQVEIEYSKRCERVASLLGVQVFGGSAGIGFTTTNQVHIPHVVVDFLDNPEAEEDPIMKRLVDWIVEKNYARGHRTGELLRDAITCINKMQRGIRRFKAPPGTVVDDKGEVIAGTWTRKNGGHGEFWWRFDAQEVVSDDD